MARTALTQVPNSQQVSYLPPGQLLYYPSAIPYPTAIRRGWIPNPNAQAVDWPSAQFAPEYLPAEDGSIQQFSYFKADHPTVLYGDGLTHETATHEDKSLWNRWRDGLWGPKEYLYVAGICVLGYVAVTAAQRAWR